MKQPGQAPPERSGGRSMRDPSRPLGEEILRRSQATTPPTQEDFRNRATQAGAQAAADPSGLAQRAKVIGVLRKAEEFMSTSNPAPDTDQDVRRALELACGRLGLTFREYRALADADPELLELERDVLADARERWGTVPAATASAPFEPSAPELPERTHADRILERVFVPIDYTMACHAAVAIALEMRRTHGSAVCLFHAVESTGSDDWLAGIGSPSVGGDWIAEAKGRLRRFLTNIAPDADPGIELRACIGLPVRSLCREAHRWGATLVVTAASMQARLVRSPAEKLVRELQLPVLIIPTV